ncbi:MAG: M15 family metallopeptidase [bacterium]|nr:M15 family metallopeptidase [bacterium]
MDYQILVNKDNSLDKDYIPKNLVLSNSIYKDGIMVDKLVLEAFNKMKEEAKKYNYEIDIMSGYRSYSYQDKLFNNLVNEKGFNYAYNYIAKAGTSEHQTGLAIDFVIYKDDKCYIEHDVEGLNETLWIHQNAHKYGFIVRYPKDKEEITKYNYEPWHLRYVGNIANSLYNNDLTLEEYKKRIQ